MCATLELEVAVAGVEATYRRHRDVSPGGLSVDLVLQLLSIALNGVEQAERAWLEARGALRTHEDVAGALREATAFQFVLQTWGRVLQLFSTESSLVPVWERNNPAGLHRLHEFLGKLPALLADVTAILEDRQRQLKEIEAALAVRRRWMELMGLPGEEIDELCRPDVDPRPTIEEETRQLEAAQRLKTSAPSYAELLAWSAKKAK